ncbi:hypothetical protein [Gluconobacter oxydans]|uniref:hypothetical protein n=1 Tax=Gluconobacter oxydans TaxID=442 RepID=UPI00346392D8
MSVDEILGQPAPVGATVYRRGDVVCVGMPLPDLRQWEVHVAAAPHARGREAVAAMRSMLTEFWDSHPDVDELIAVPRAENRAVRVTNNLIGFALSEKVKVLWPDGIERETCIYRMPRP